MLLQNSSQYVGFCATNLLLQQLLLTGDVSTIALGKHVLAKSCTRRVAKHHVRKQVKRS
jgi:hypothetical protein